MLLLWHWQSAALTTRLAFLIGYDTEENNGEVGIYYNFVFDVADNDTLIWHVIEPIAKETSGVVTFFKNSFQRKLLYFQSS